MLVGDYCPRALDPILEVRDALKKKEQEMKKAAKPTPAPTPAIPPAPPAAPKKKEEPVVEPEKTTELPCNTFGTVDRCDGMGC
jgi:hypothetical protein|mmetsp:Transcript_13457/g.18421  ORF Transcript_13457/g.18421 Transcript_13457/m.18421 type:complete len:83 (-) Transcript_13457:2200-2448(-)